MKAVSDEPIPVAGPWITEREVELVAEAARTAWYDNHYSYNKKFETMFATYAGVKHAVSLPHCTSAIHLSLAALDIGPDDEVIVPDVTWIASVAPVFYVGAKPVLVDILQDTWCIDPRAVERAIGPKTKAIIGVDLYGSMCDWAALQRISQTHGVELIEDAAEALGSTYHSRPAGSLGKTGVFSFHGSKTVATGEGGMLVTDDDDLHARIQMLRDHGRAPGDRFFLNEKVAFKYKMNAVTAALGLAQLERIDELIARKRDIFRWYRERLGNLNGIALNVEPAATTNSYWMVTAIVDPAFGLGKFDIMAAMKERNIDTRPFFSPLSSLPAFADKPETTQFVSRKDNIGHSIAERGVNLPSGYNMSEQRVDVVCRALKDVLGL